MLHKMYFLSKFNLNFLSEKQIKCLVFVLCALTGTVSAIFFYNENPDGDAGYYYRTAMTLKENFSTLFNTPKIGVIESLNAIFQWLVMLLPGNDFGNVYLLQIIVYALTGLFIFKLGELFIGRSGALVVVFFYLINHQHWRWIYNFKPAVWCNFFIILVFYYAFRVFKFSDKTRHFILTGVFSALLLLTDLRYLPHLLFMYFLFLFTSVSSKLKLRNIALSFLVLILIISFWIVRQSIVFHKFVFISDKSTITIDRAFNTKSYQGLRNYAHVLEPLSEEQFNSRFWELTDSLNLTPGEMIHARVLARVSAMEKEDICIKQKYNELIKSKVFNEEQIISIIEKEEKKSYLRKVIDKGLILWQPFSFRYSYQPLKEFKSFIPPASKMNNLNRIITVGILLPFLIVGGCMLVYRQNLFGILLVNVFIIHTLVHVLSYVEWRYLLPILPLVTIVAVYGFKNIFQFLHANKNG